MRSANEEQLDIRRKTLSADVFIASCNAVSTGDLW